MDSLICQGCKQRYDIDQRAPVILLKCFHSICKHCYMTKSQENDQQPQEMIIICPECGKPSSSDFNNIPFN
jgi:uncharacterized protein YbaR (Trm112 family)